MPEFDFRIINGKMETVNTRVNPSKLLALKASFDIKPWSTSKERRTCTTIMRAALGVQKVSVNGKVKG